ncbi:MAG: hypothetical protein CL484_02535 [Acidobacteria bacterium]|nr:hypothetical protein [Acidobacteriota bacterium]
MTFVRASLYVTFFFVAGACAPSRVILPQGSGIAYPAYASLFDTVVANCRRVRTFEAMIGIQGRGTQTNFSGRVRAGLAKPASIRLEGLAPFGTPGFYLVAAEEEATLWLTRQGRVVTDVPAVDILAALTGIPFGPGDLLAVLTGCLVPESRPLRGRSVGGWIVVDLSGGASAYLRLMGNDYHLVAGTRDGLTIEYGGFRRGMPTVVRVFSTEPGVGRQAGLPIDITASLSQLNLNVQLEKSTFSLQLPMNVVPMTLEELNRAGPLRVPLGRQ